jgi:hypothetical protein
MVMAHGGDYQSTKTMKITDTDTTTFADLKPGGYFQWRTLLGAGDIFFKESETTLRNVTLKGPEKHISASYFGPQDPVRVVNSF